MSKYSVKLKRLFKANFTLNHLIPSSLLILALLVVLLPFARIEASSPLNGEMTLSKAVDLSSPKPGDKINFTITYSNDMSETAYNVTIFEWMPSGLTFVSSKPFYDGVSAPETGFYRWSRGNVPPLENGAVVVKAMVENVPVGTVITNTAHLSYELENGTRVEVSSSVGITVAQAAGVDVYLDQIHSVGPYTGAWTQFNVTVTNTGNGLDTFNISLRSVALNPSGSTHDWTIILYNSTGYPTKPVATVYDDNQYDRNSWTDHGVLTDVTLASGESTWFIIRVIEPGGTSGSGDAYLDVLLTAKSLFDPDVSDLVDKMTIVKSVAGITFGPDYSRYANPGALVVFRHIIVNSGQPEVVDLSYTSPSSWSYSFWFDNGTALKDTDGSGYVDIGVLPKEDHVYILVKVTVPYGTAAGTNDTAVITAKGVTSGSFATATDITIVLSAPILGVDKRLVSGNPVYVGDFATYQINITNLGNTKLTKIPLDDAYETSSLDFYDANPAEDAYDEIAGTIHWENLTALESSQSVLVTVNFMATAADDIVRESANVIDAEDEFSNLISVTFLNTELKIIGFHKLTVTASPSEAVGGSFSVSWTEHGIMKDGTFNTQKEITCDQDTTPEVSNPESPIANGDTRYVFRYYSPSSAVTMDSDKTITLNYRTECTLAFQQIGSLEPVYVTINGTQLTEALPQSFWVYKGSTTTFSYPSPVTDLADTTRYVLTGVSGNTTETSVTVNSPTSVAGSYKTQYYLNVTTDPVGLDTPQYSGWYDSGVYANIEVETPTGGDGVSTRYRFDQWTGVGIVNPTSSSTEIMMDAPKTATAHFVKQYYITIISLHDSPTSSQWVDEGSDLDASVTSPTEIVTGQTQWRCTGYDLDGETKQGTSHAFENIQAPHRIEFYWVQQFWLQVDTTLSEATITGTGWYDVGTSAPISATTPYQPSPTHQFIFTSWASIGPNEAPITAPASSSTTVTMNNYYTVQANWQEQWYITVISAHGDPTPSQWVNATDSLMVSVTSPSDDDGAGTRYRCTGYTVDEGNPEEGTSYTLVNVQAAHTIEFGWMAQYYLTVKISPPEVPETILGEGWYDEGTLASLTASSLVSVSEGVRYRFAQWTVDTTTFTTNDITVNMDVPKTATGKYVRLFSLTVTTNPIGLDDPTGEGWYDEGTYAGISVDTPTGGDGVSTRYRFLNWIGTGIADAVAPSTTILMDTTKAAEANFLQQFYLTTSANLGDVSPDSGWYDEGSVVLIEATAPEVIQGKGYVWHGWTGTGEGSYNGVDNPATVVLDSAVSEAAHWKIDPILTVAVSNDTIASGDRIVVHGKVLPVQSSVMVTINYVFPNGTQKEHIAYTNDEGDYEDTLLIGHGYLYSLFVESGTWVITARRPGDVNRETAEAFTSMEIGEPSIAQLHPALIAGLIVAGALIAYVLVVKKVKNNKDTWWRATVILGCAGLIFGVVSLALNWVFVTGTATIENITYQVGFLIYPFGNGLVSITEGIQYIGTVVPSMVDPTWQSILGSTGPVLTLWLIPVGCSLLLLSVLYKPKNVRQRSLKVAILVISGVFIVASAVNALGFVQGQVGALQGAGTGYGAGVYLVIISGTLTLLSGLFSSRETLVKSAQAEMA